MPEESSANGGLLPNFEFRIANSKYIPHSTFEIPHSAFRLHPSAFILS